MCVLSGADHVPGTVRPYYLRALSPFVLSVTCEVAIVIKLLLQGIEERFNHLPQVLQLLHGRARIYLRPTFMLLTFIILYLQQRDFWKKNLDRYPFPSMYSTSDLIHWLLTHNMFSIYWNTPLFIYFYLIESSEKNCIGLTKSTPTDQHC